MNLETMKTREIEQLAEEIRKLYRSHPLQPETAIETFLERQLSSYSPIGKQNTLANLAELFSPVPNDEPVIGKVSDDLLGQVCALLLGSEVGGRLPSSSDLLQRLAESLNIIFDELNQLMAVMHLTLTGQPLEEQTIRHAIASNLVSQERTGSLAQYLGQVRRVFLTVQQGFKQAAQEQIGRLIDELDPAKIESQLSSSLKFGPLKKAESYAIYSRKYADIRQWFDSGRFMQDFLRSFEAHCRSFRAP